MSAIYSTSDYFRDSFWIIDVMFNFFKKTKSKFQKKLSGIFEHDFETYFFRFVENLPLAFYFFLIGTFLVLGILRATEKENRIKVATILTNSMSPEISPGSLVFASPFKDYDINDIVIYKERSIRSEEHTGRNLAHRIIEVKKEGSSNTETSVLFIMKGDNNPNPDPGEIHPGDIIGKVFFKIPYLGYLDFLVTTLPGFLIFIAVPTIIVLNEARKYAQS